MITDRSGSVETVTLGVWVNVGARNELVKQNGLSHFLEHMAFKGTKCRSAFEIAAAIENVGGHLNAYTSRDTTVYYATVLKENFSLALDVISDILKNSTFSPQEFEREKAVIIQEIGQVSDTPDDVIFDKFQETAFPNQALGRPITGTIKSVDEMVVDEVRGYMESHYSAKRMIVSAAGNIKQDQFYDESARLFSSVGLVQTPKMVEACYIGGEYREIRELEQVHIILGFEGVKYDDCDYYSLALLSTVLGGGMSSRLFQEAREKRGLAYSIYSFSSSYEDSGTFGIYAGTAEDKVEDLVNILCEELCRVATETIREKEILRAKTQIKAGILMSLENTSSRAERLARHIQVHDRVIPISEIAAQIDQLNTCDVMQVARRILHSPPTVAAIGPVNNLFQYEKIKDRLAV